MPFLNEAYPVSFHDVDCFGSLRLSRLFDFMQDAAGKNADSLGIGYEDMAMKGFGWMMSKVIIEIDRYPCSGETVYIETWPKSVEKLISLRDFAVRDEHGDEVARATTAWIMINMNTRRPERLTDYCNIINPDAMRHAIADRPDRINTSGLDFDIEENYKALFSSIDINGHVNNTCYLDWIVDVFPLERHKSSHIKSARINFINEIKYGDRITVKAHSRGDKEHLIDATLTAVPGTQFFQAHLLWS